MARRDLLSARTNAIVDLSAAIGLIILGVSPQNQNLAIGVIIAGFIGAFAYRAVKTSR